MKSRFEVLSVLGEGGSGVVYRAIDRDTGETVAVKTLRSPSADALALLRNEFRVVQGIHHPNLVEIRDLCHEGGEWRLSMEYVDGDDFIRYVDANCGDAARPWRFEPHRLRKGLAELAAAVAALHQAARVHRDLKPSNVLVTRAGRVVVLDFGLTFDADAAGRRLEQGIAGTAHFMAPEQVAADGSVGPAADWYAFGVILFRALTGRLPFEGPSFAVMEAKLTEAPPDPATMAADVPEDLATLCRALLEPDPALRIQGDAVLRQLGAREVPDTSHAIFVGREREMRALHRAYADVVEGDAVTVFVQGESGVGKSVFARAFADDLRRSDAPPLVLFGRCYERETAPFKAFATVIDGLAEHLIDRPPEEVDALLPDGSGLFSTIFPELSRVEAVAARADAAPLDPSETRRRVFTALRELITRIAARRRAVVVIDDLQWADADSFELLAELMRPPKAPAILLVATMRAGSESGRGGPRMAEKLPGDVRAVSLERLGRESAMRLVAELSAAGGARVDAAALRALLDEAGGHPMFLAELVRQRANQDASVPTTKLDDALRGRVSTLPTTARRLLEVICLVGLAIPQQMAGRAAALEENELSSAVTLLRAEHLVQTQGARRRDPIEPYHDRIREAVVASLDPLALKERHGRLARAIELSEARDPEMLAHHWLEAGDSASAAKYAVIAADRASTLLAFDRAARLYCLALRFSAPDSRDALALRLKIAEALTNAGRWAEAAEHRLSVAEHAEKEEAFTLRRIAAEQLLSSGHFDRGEAILMAQIRSLGIFVPRSRIVILLGVLAMRLLLRIRGVAYVERAESAVSPRERARIDVLVSAGYGLAVSDNLLANYFMTRGALLALRVGEIHRVVRALAMVASFGASDGARTAKSLAATRELVAATSAAAARAGAPIGRGLALHTEAWMHYFTASFVLAKRNFLAAEAVYREQCVGVTWLLNTARSFGARALASLGELVELEERITPWLREADAIGDVHAATNLRAGPWVLVRLAGDRPDLALEEIAWVEERLPKARFLVQHFSHLTACVMVELYEGHCDAALAKIDGAKKRLSASFLLRIASIRSIDAEHDGRASLAVAARDASRREALLARAEKAAARLDGEHVPMTDGAAALVRAGIARLRGDDMQALALVRRAHAEFTRAEMAVQAAAVLYAEGKLEGGADGARKVEAATTSLEIRGIRAPARFIAMLLPGGLTDEPAAPAIRPQGSQS